ncbi:MAG: 50S ribosomal protein L11 methyltransferase [bacterium]
MSGVDQAMRVVLPRTDAEVAGAILMDLLGPFEQQWVAGTNGAAGIPAAGGPTADRAGEMVALVFYRAPDVRSVAGQAWALDEILAALPAAMRDSGRVWLETYDVSRDWVEGWKDHFRPIVIGDVRLRPPWEPPLGPTGTGSLARHEGVAAAEPGAREPLVPVDVVINPGLGFGTGLHPTTRGTLQLLQEGAGRPRGPLVDAGTGSGVLAIAAAKLGWKPVIAFDNDPAALRSARENIERNGVEEMVRVREADVAGASPDWFSGATVAANMTLESVTALVRKLATGSAAFPGCASVTARVGRLVVSGILAGEQERELVRVARRCSFAPGLRIAEAEWVSLELLPTSSPQG